MYTKLFSKIVDSSIWLEDDRVRLVWLTLLAVMDEDGFVNLAAPGNVANRARVDPVDAAKALQILESPDENSSNPANEGRRIERVDGGWIVLNAKVYRDLVKREHEKALNRARVSAHRKKKCNGDVMPPNENVTPSDTYIDTDTEDKASQGSAFPPPPKSAKAKIAISWDMETGWSGIGYQDRSQWGEAYPACDIDRQLAAAHQWLLSNPSKAHRKQWRRFITGWLSRSQERGGDIKSNRPAPNDHRAEKRAREYPETGKLKML